MGRGTIEAGTGRMERFSFEVRSDDPATTSEGEMWIRSDLAPESDQIATLRFDAGGGTVWDIPIYDASATTDGVEKVLRVPVGGTVGFVPVTAGAAAFREIGYQHAGSRLGVHDALASSSIPASGISQEEDGDIQDWTGEPSYYGTVSSPTIDGSDYAISFSNDGDERYIDNSFESGEYERFSMHIYPEELNSEALLWDSSSSSVILGVYFNTSLGIHYAGANNATGDPFANPGPSRTNGTELVSDSNTSAQYYHIEFANIDWVNETCDILVDGAVEVADASFHNSGVPNQIRLTSNYSSPGKTGGYIDKIDTGGS